MIVYLLVSMLLSEMRVDVVSAALARETLYLSLSPHSPLLPENQHGQLERYVGQSPLPYRVVVLPLP